MKDEFPLFLLGCLVGSILTIVATILLSDQAGLLGSTLLANPSAMATVAAAFVGFVGVILTTRAGFKNLIASQEAQGHRDREARSHAHSVAETSKERDRDHDRKVLAAAIHGEIVALMRKVHGCQTWLRVQKGIYKKQVDDRHFHWADAEFQTPRFSVPIYESSIPKLGLLGPSLTTDIVDVYARALAHESVPTKILSPQGAMMVTEGLLMSYENWPDEIIHVGARLAAVQGFTEKDPGSLYEYRKKRDELLKATQATG